jgi:hypothetical protein
MLATGMTQVKATKRMMIRMKRKLMIQELKKPKMISIGLKFAEIGLI